MRGGCNEMGKSIEVAEADGRYMEAVAHLISEERERIQADLQRRYEMFALQVVRVGYFTTDADRQRANAYIAVAAEAVEQLRDFIGTKHAAFLSESPKRFLLRNWQELANKQLGTICAFCACGLDEVVNRAGRADPALQREFIQAWDDRWAPLVLNFSKRLESDTVLKTPRDTQKAGPLLSKKFLAEEVAKPVIVAVMALVIAGAIALWHFVLSELPLFNR
jgi:hypothetical protein